MPWKPITIKPNDQSLVGRKIKVSGGNEAIINCVGEFSVYIKYLRYPFSEHIIHFDTLLKDWLIWEEPKPRWRASSYGIYWSMISLDAVDFLIAEFTDVKDEDSNRRFKSGNYFRTKQQAQHFADECRKVAERLHEESQE